MEIATFVILMKWEPSNMTTQTVIFYKSVGIQWQYICAKSNFTFWSENEARMACYQMGMSWEEGSGNTN